MDELIEVMKDIRNSLEQMEDTLSDIKEQLGEIQGEGLYNSLTDIYDKLDNIEAIIPDVD